MMQTSLLAGCRVMVVEDELLVAMMVEELLSEAACVVVGPFARVHDAVEAAHSGDVDLAVLDVNVDGEKVYPIAEALVARGVPILLLSGYGAEAVPANHPEWPVCCKPFRAEELLRLLSAQIRPVLAERRRLAVVGA